jgi:hypothetical protein
VTEEITILGLVYSSLREKWKCEGHFERQPAHQKAFFKVFLENDLSKMITSKNPLLMRENRI